MPTPRLPLELHLYILDLAIPPRAFDRPFYRNQPPDQTRLEATKRLALVCRAWRDHLRQYAAEQLVLDLTEPHTRLALLDKVTSSARRIRRVDLCADARATDWEGVAIEAVAQVQELEELSIRQYVTRADNAEDYWKLECCAWDSQQRPTYGCLPSLAMAPQGLRFLSLVGYDLDIENQTHIGRLPHLETLLLTLAGVVNHGSQPFDCLLKAPLRILGLRRIWRNFMIHDALTPISERVEHLAIASEAPDLLQAWAERGIRLSSNLKSLTIVTSPLSMLHDRPSHVEEAAEALESACKGAGVDLNLVRCKSDEELRRFDLEEWARSVDS